LKKLPLWTPLPNFLCAFGKDVRALNLFFSSFPGRSQFGFREWVSCAFSSGGFHRSVAVYVTMEATGKNVQMARYRKPRYSNRRAVMMETGSLGTSSNPW
jgi:hypothetical protein